MERNGSTTGGDDSNSKDIIHEDGVIDELTPPSLNVPDGCLRCPRISGKIREWERLVSEFEDTKRLYPELKGELSRLIALQALREGVDTFKEGAERMQTRINRLTKGCPGAITFSGYSARTGKVEGALCDNPIYCYPEPGVAGSETATVVREGSQKIEEHGESGDLSGEQDS